MMRRVALFFVLLVVATCPLSSRAAVRSEVIAEPAANALGLTRPWVQQAPIDRGRSRLTNLLYDGGTLFAQSDRAVLQAYDGETGRPLWETPRQVGNSNYPSLPLAVSPDLLAVVNGSKLHVLNRYSGAVLWEKALESAPAAGPVLTDQRVYVPLANSQVISYRLKPLVDPLRDLGKTRTKDEIEADAAAYTKENLKLSQEYVPPVSVQSTGMPMAAPIVVRQTEEEEIVAWPTDRGYLFFASFDRTADSFTLKYRVDMGSAQDVRVDYGLTCVPGNPKDPRDAGTAFGAARNGLVLGVSVKTGDNLWQYAAVDPPAAPPAVIGDRLFVGTQLGGLHCIDAKVGTRKWWSPHAAYFIAASKDRVYAADRGGNLLVVDARSGAELASLPAVELTVRALNEQNDRLYLASAGGTIQCLREEQITQPLVHALPRHTEKYAKAKTEKAEKAPPKAAGEAPAAPHKPAADRPKKEKVERKPVEKTPKPKPGAKDKKNPFG